MTDTFGRTMRDALEGKNAKYIIERDDGFIRHATAQPLIRPFEEWDEAEKDAIQNRQDSFLDIGCGVARVGDYVKSQGMEYYGTDLSPLAVEMCHKRGFGTAAINLPKVGHSLDVHLTSSVGPYIL